MRSGSYARFERNASNCVIPLGERHLRRSLAEFVAHYHGERNHQGLGNELVDRPPPQCAFGTVVGGSGLVESTLVCAMICATTLAGCHSPEHGPVPQRRPSPSIIPPTPCANSARVGPTRSKEADRVAESAGVWSYVSPPRVAAAARYFSGRVLYDAARQRQRAPRQDQQLQH
jgi:hypothetical protein